MIKTIDALQPIDLSQLSNAPKRIIIGHGIDYYKLFYALKLRYKSSYLLESLAQPQHQDRYYSLGFSPLLEFRAKGNTLTISGKPRTITAIFGVNSQNVVVRGCNPYQYLQQQFPMQTSAAGHEGGLVGYFAYEAVNYFEPTIQLPEHANFDTFHIGLYADGLTYDTTTDQLTYYTYGKDRSPGIRKLIKNLGAYTIPTTLISAKSNGYSATKAQHTKAVQHMLDNIRAGNSFQGEVGYKANYIIKGDKLAVYHQLRQINPSPYMFYIVFNDVEVMGASPEILIKSSGGNALTTPTAGTAQRGNSEAKDKQLARQLLASPKEIAEHTMLVDQHRNDISRVCVPGTVTVSNLMYISKFSHVQHITSDVIGQVAKGKNGYDLLASILPGGVAAGAPKLETIKIIHESEVLPRGPYGGAAGRFSMNGDTLFYLPIRSLFCKGNNCFTQTSSGIVYDSRPSKEYAEIAHKHAAIKNAITLAGGTV